MTKSALFSVRKNEPCPQCGAELVIRSGKHGPFLGCSHYPDCDYVRPLKSQADGHIVKVLEGQVPILRRCHGTPGAFWYVHRLQSLSRMRTYRAD